MRLLRGWFDSWAGIGRVAAGLARQSYDLQLTRYGNEGWRATFYAAGRAHSQTARPSGRLVTLVVFSKPARLVVLALATASLVLPPPVAAQWDRDVAIGDERLARHLLSDGLSMNTAQLVVLWYAAGPGS